MKGFLAWVWGWLAGRACSLARTARFLLKISWRFCLITTVRFWRGCQKSNFGVEFYLLQWKSFFVAFHIRKAENPWTKGFRRCSLASIRGFGPPTPRLGVHPGTENSLHSMSIKVIQSLDFTAFSVNFRKDKKTCFHLRNYSLGGKWWIFHH